MPWRLKLINVIYCIGLTWFTPQLSKHASSGYGTSSKSIGEYPLYVAVALTQILDVRSRVEGTVACHAKRSILDDSDGAVRRLHPSRPFGPAYLHPGLERWLVNHKFQGINRAVGTVCPLHYSVYLIHRVQTTDHITRGARSIVLLHDGWLSAPVRALQLSAYLI